MDNETIFLTKPGYFEIKKTEIPVIGPDDVLVKIRHIGICGSDVAFFEDPTIGGKIDTQLPIVLGHECGGVIVDIGRNVTGLKKGDTVALEPGIPCGKCEWCLSGKYNLCPDVNFMAAPPFKSACMSRYVSHPAIFTHKLPKGLDTIDGALTEPLSVGFHAAERACVTPYKNIVILGAGCIGQMTLQACRYMGANKIIVADLFDNRLEIAKQHGAMLTVNTAKEDIKKIVMELTEGKYADLVFETAGNSVTTRLAVPLVKRGGAIVMVGNVYGETSFPFFEINEKEANIISIFRYCNTYPAAIEAQKQGLVNVSNIVTREFPFEHAQQAFECAINEKQTALKVMITL